MPVILATQEVEAGRIVVYEVNQGKKFLRPAPSQPMVGGAMVHDCDPSYMGKHK
jgi:hypothetical protein